MILQMPHVLKMFKIKHYIWPCVEPASVQSAWCDWLAFFTFDVYLSIYFKSARKVWLQQCVGTMETARRGPLCDISTRYNIINHGVMELYTHEVTKRTENNIHFHAWWRVNEDSVVTRAWCGQNVAWSDTVISTHPKAGNSPADRVMYPCDVTQWLWKQQWSNEAISGRQRCA